MNLNFEQLQRILPHRPPILLIREVRELVPGEKGTGIRLFTDTDSCFEGHFPGRPILPGIMVTEACAQTAMAVFLAADMKEAEVERLGVLARIEKMQFLAMIIPPIEVSFSVIVERRVGPFAFVNGVAHAGEDTFAKGELVLKLLN